MRRTVPLSTHKCIGYPKPFIPQNFTAATLNSSTEESRCQIQTCSPHLILKINQNQLVLEPAIMKLTLWVEQRGSGEVAGKVRGALETISKNEEFIQMTLAVLMTPE